MATSNPIFSSSAPVHSTIVQAPSYPGLNSAASVLPNMPNTASLPTVQSTTTTTTYTTQMPTVYASMPTTAQTNYRAPLSQPYTLNPYPQTVYPQQVYSQSQIGAVTNSGAGVFSAPQPEQLPKKKKFMIKRHTPGCCGILNFNGLFDQGTGSCRFLNCGGCCDRDRITYKRRGASDESIEAVRKVNKGAC